MNFQYYIYDIIYMKIGIVVGIKTDAISEYRYPEWLHDIPKKLVIDFCILCEWFIEC